MDVDNPDGLLKPDELAGMTLTGRTDSKLTVPNAAIVRERQPGLRFRAGGATEICAPRSLPWRRRERSPRGAQRRSS